MRMNGFMFRQVQQPAKPVIFVVLDTRNQKREEKAVVKDPSKTFSFGGHRHFEFKRIGDRLGDDPMGRQKNPMIKSEQNETSKDKTPAKTEETAKRPANAEKEKRSLDYGPEVQPGGFRIPPGTYC